MTRFVTVRGKRQDAEKELSKLVNAAHDGTLVEPNKVTVAEYVRAWLDGAHCLSGKTVERYRQLTDQQIIPHLGSVALQKLKPAQVADWHGKLLRAGGFDGRPLGARTVGHAHRILHRALQRAVESELLPRNAASVIKPPKVDTEEVEILTGEQIGAVLRSMEGHTLHPIVPLALATGRRRGELLALQWCDVDLDGASLRVERSLEETKAGLQFKTPKTKHGRRTTSLPQSAVDVLRDHRRQQIELRLALGQGKHEPDALVFSTLEGAAFSPYGLSRNWRRTVSARGLPKLRHSHASALIASGLDVLTISRRLGHGSPVVTLNTYAHLFEKTHTAAATAIEAAMRIGPER